MKVIRMADTETYMGFCRATTVGFVLLLAVGFGASATSVESSRDMTCKIPEPDADELGKDPRIQALSGKLAANAGDRESLKARSEIYALKGAYTLALADLNAAVDLGAASSEILNDRCYVRAVLDDLTGAAQDCDESLRLDSSDADAFDSRGFLRLKSGEFQAAIADFDAALRLDPKQASSLYGRGIAKIRIGDSTAGEVDLHAGMYLNGVVGNELASRGIPDPHPEWGLEGVVHISEDGIVTVANGVEINGMIADTRQEYRPGDDRYEEVVRHLCGLQPRDQKSFRPWRHY